MTYEDDYSFCKKHMVGDEYILWKGKPAKGNLLSGSDIFMIPFSLLWCGFAIFWEATAIINDAPFFFAIFGIPFVFLGLYIVFGRFLVTAYMRKHTLYVITNKKIIRLRGKQIDMLTAATMPPAQTVIHRNGNGTIRFNMPNPYYRGGYRSPMHVNGMDFGAFSLENIPDIARVQQAIDSMEKSI